MAAEALDSEESWRNLAFGATLETDLYLLKPCIDYCLSLGFRNISVAYTSSLHGRDWPSLPAVWRDVSLYLAKATEDSRKEYVDINFVARLREDFAKLNDFHAAATIQKDIVLDSRLLADLVAATPAKRDSDFQKLVEEFREADLDDRSLKPVNDCLSTDSPLGQIDRYLSSFRTNLERLGKTINRSIYAVLREMGIQGDERVNGLNGFQQLGLVEAQLIGDGAVSATLAKFFSSDEFLKAKTEVRRTLLESIRAFPEARDVRRPDVTDEDLEPVVSRLVQLLVAVDAAKSREIRMNAIQGALTTLCPFKDRQLRSDESQLLYRSSADALVVDRIFAASEPARWRELCVLLRNYHPRYPQFCFERYEMDKFKAAFLQKSNTRAKLLELEDTLLYSLEQLLAMRKQVETGVNVNEMLPRIKAIYALRILEGRGFNVGQFIRDNETIEEHVQSIQAQLQYALDNAPWVLGHGGHPDVMSRALDVVNGKLRLVRPGWPVITSTNLKRESDRLASELKVAGRLFAYVTTNCPDKEKRSSLLSPVSDTFQLDGAFPFLEGLDIYVERMKFMLVFERASYLDESKWLSRLPADFTAFLKPAIDPHQLLGEGVPADAINSGFVKEKFVEGIRRLREKADFWHATAQ